ncbi:MAG: hypothetical protein SPF23_03410, partial [Paludibacteraceae bacterium]|nr:hypothetical protein [Paludibacteraceae bacterium]
VAKQFFLYFEPEKLMMHLKNQMKLRPGQQFLRLEQKHKNLSAPVFIPLDVIRHPLLSVHPSRILARAHNTNNPAISDRAVSFSSSVLFAGDGVFGTVIDISGLAAKPDTRADYRLRHHLCLFYYRLLIHLFHNNYCLLC